MIDTPQITRTTEQLAAMIHLMIPRSEIRSAMGSGITEVMAAVKAQGSVPVTAPVIPVGRVKPAYFQR